MARGWRACARRHVRLPGRRSSASCAATSPRAPCAVTHGGTGHGRSSRARAFPWRAARRCRGVDRRWGGPWLVRPVGGLGRKLKHGEPCDVRARGPGATGVPSRATDVGCGGAAKASGRLTLRAGRMGAPGRARPRSSTRVAATATAAVGVRSAMLMRGLGGRAAALAFEAFARRSCPRALVGARGSSRDVGGARRR